MKTEQELAVDGATAMLARVEALIAGLDDAMAYPWHCRLTAPAQCVPSETAPEDAGDRWHRSGSCPFRVGSEVPR